MQKTKRDRTGEKYGEYTIIGPTEKDKVWLARCSCGREIAVENGRMWKLTRCKSCAAKLRADDRRPKKDKYTEMKNWMKPKRPKFEHEAFYKIEDRDRFYQPVVGKLINEYGKSASFEIINWHEVDEKTLKGLNYRINVSKKKVMKIE